MIREIPWVIPRRRGWRCQARSGTYSAGVAADVDGRWRVDVKYVDFFGYTADNGTMVTRANGLLALLENRGHVVLTAKATF